MSHLYATTDLEKNVRLNFNMIGLDGKPKVKSLKEIISEWLIFRRETTTRRLDSRLDKVLERLHILDGLLIAYLNIDEIIAIIRSEDEPKEVLMARFNLTEKQANSILDTKLRHLAKLEEFKLKAEKNELIKERDYLELHLNNEDKMTELMTNELKEIKKKYADERRSEIKHGEDAKAFSESELLPTENITVILSKLGWIRQAKGHEINPMDMNYRSGDDYLTHTKGRSNEFAIFADNQGRVYSTKAVELPSARGQGEPVTGLFNMSHQEPLTNISLSSIDGYILLASKAGFGFVAEINQVLSKNRSGKQILSVPDKNGIVSPSAKNSITDETMVVCITNQGRMLSFPLSELPTLSKGKGNKLINMPSNNVTGELLSWIFAIDQQDQLRLFVGKRFKIMNYNDILEYQGRRASRGKLLPQGFKNISSIFCEKNT